MILDIIVIAIILISVFIGYKVGAARALFSLIGSIVSFLLAVLLGRYLTTLIYDGYIKSSIVKSISDSLTINTQSALSQESLPPFVRFALNFTGNSFESTAVDTFSDAPDIIANGIEVGIRPIVTSVLSFALTGILFLIIYFLFRFLLLKLLLSVFKLPVLRGINRLLGAVCSLITSVLFISFAAFLLRLITPYVTDMPYILSESTIYNSYIFYHFYSGNIFYALTSIF